DKLLPGWVKPAGRPARATFTAVSAPQLTRLEELVIEANGTSVKGTVEVDDVGEIVSAQLPVFQISDGDKAMLRADRGPHGALPVMMRGEVYDGRGFVKQILAGSPTDQTKQKPRDIDLDIRLGTVAGFHGEAARGVDLRMSRRGGEIKSFTLSAKLGRDTPLNGDLRGRTGGGNVLYVGTARAGALFPLCGACPQGLGGGVGGGGGPPAR